jgi:ABC-type phosphate/phosphonate transport system substrate-binding protein
LDIDTGFIIVAGNEEENEPVRERQVQDTHSATNDDTAMKDVSILHQSVLSNNGPVVYVAHTDDEVLRQLKDIETSDLTQIELSL